MDFKKTEKRWPQKTLTSSRGLRPRSRRASLRGKQEDRGFVVMEKKWAQKWEEMGLYGVGDCYGLRPRNDSFTLLLPFKF